MKVTEASFYEISKVLNADEGEGKLISVAARPGMGKTTLSLRIMADIVKVNETRVLFFSLELSKAEVLNILSDKEELPPKALSKIYIYDKKHLNTNFIKEKINGIENPSVIFIDSIELMPDYAAGNKSKVLRELKKICKEKNISIIYNCKLSRGSDNQTDKRPRSSDLDEEILKNTDTVFALYRSAYYTGDDPAAELRTLKNSFGELVMVPLHFDSKHLSFDCDNRRFFDNKPEKRVELSVHTKMSDDVSTISVRDAFDFAACCGYRAIAFTNFNNVQDFPEIQKIAKEYNGIKVIYGVRIFYEKNGCGVGEMTLLVKKQSGIGNLYKIISAKAEGGFCNAVDIKSIEQHREQLLCSACGDLSELFWAIHNGEPYDQIVALAASYDYIEIFPSNDSKTREIYKIMVELGKKINIPVVAAGDCHYCFKKDEISRRVVKEFKGGCEDNDQQYFRTTEQMLEAFAYLGEKDAYDVVVKNTNLIADTVGSVEPIPIDFQTPYIQRSDDLISEAAYTRAKSIYGKQLPHQLSERLDSELEIIKKNNFSSIYMLSHLLTKFAHENGQPTSSRGAVGSSLLAYLLEITNVNPLPPHYFCKKCGHTEFITNGSVYSGFNLPTKKCPVCTTELNTDGHNIPFESFSRFEGNIPPDIDLNFPFAFKNKVLEYLCELFGTDKIFIAGTLQKITPEIAEMYVNMYEEKNDISFDRKTEHSILTNITGVKRKESPHPCGVFIIPKGNEICDYTPTDTIIGDFPIPKKTHLDFFALHNSIYKADILGWTPLEALLLLERYTEVCPKNIDIKDPEIYELFKSSHIIGINSDEPATSGIPDFDTEFVRNMLKQIKPSNFGDLVIASSLAHGTNTWTYNTENLLKNNICSLKSLAASREDVYNYLTGCGIEKPLAFKIMQAVRKGRFAESGFNKAPEVTEVLAAHNIPDRYVDLLCGIRYMFPKSHSVEYALLAVRLAWYKINYPAEFYTAILNADYADDKFEFINSHKGKIGNDFNDGNSFLAETDGFVQLYNEDISFDAKSELFRECGQRGISFKRNYNYCESDEPYFVKDGIIFINY